MLEEQREIKRKPVILDVKLSSEKIGEQPCRIRDMSLNGAFIEYDNETLDADDHIQLDMTIDQNGKNTKHRVAAEVIRVSEDGAALRFRQVDMDTFGSILGLLYVSK